MHNYYLNRTMMMSCQHNFVSLYACICTLRLFCSYLLCASRSYPKKKRKLNSDQKNKKKKNLNQSEMYNTG